MLLQAWHWVWNNLIAPWPDVARGTFEVRDVANLLVAFVGALLAGLAIVLTIRQLRMSQKEHDRWLQEQKRFMDLRVIGQHQSQSTNQVTAINPDLGLLFVTLKVKNGGDKTANGFYWEVLIPRDLHGGVRFVNEDNDDIEARAVFLSVNDAYNKVHGHYDHKLFGYSEIFIAKLAVQNSFPRTEEFWIKWRISCEDGGVPTKGHSKIHYRRVENGFYEVKHDHPNDSEDLAMPNEEPADQSGTDVVDH